MKQLNQYNLTFSNGKKSEMYVVASNLKEAIKLMKDKYPKEFYFGKVVRCYNGGVRG